MRSSAVVVQLAVAFAVASVALAQSVPNVVLRDDILLPSTPTQFGRFGIAVAIEGDLAAVGSSEALTPTGCHGGAVFMYERAGAGWVERARLYSPNNCGGDQFGTSVAISDGRVFVGAPARDAAGPLDAGAVYVFDRQGATWTLTQELHGSSPSTGRCLGRSISAQGDTFVAGATPRPGTFVNPGEALVFTRTASGWTEQARLLASDGQNYDYFGWSIALEDDRAVVGAYGDDGTRGALYVFERSGSVWTESAKLVTTPNLGVERLGWCVDLDGGRIAAGAYFSPNVYPVGTGAVYVFELGAGGWSQSARMSAPSGGSPIAMFGVSVALAGDVLVSGTYSGPFAPYFVPGNAHVFQRASDSTWSWTHVLGATSLENLSEFGWSAAFDGHRAIVGAWKDDTTASDDSGAAYTFVIEPMVASYCTAKLNSQGCTPAVGWNGLPSLSSGAPFAITASNVINQKTGLVFYGFAPSATPFHGGTLCVAAPLQRTLPQNSGGNVGPDDCSGSYAFDFNALLQNGGDPDLFAGVKVFAQWWSRDPASQSTIGLTDALHAHVQL